MVAPLTETQVLLMRLANKDAAANAWAHELRGGLTAITQAAELVERYLARGDTAKAAEKAHQVRVLVRARVAIIDRGRLAVEEA